MLEKFQRVARLQLHIQQTLNPSGGTPLIDVGALMAGFIFPVSGDAVAGHGFHFDGAYLHFDNYAVHTH